MIFDESKIRINYLQFYIYTLFVCWLSFYLWIFNLHKFLLFFFLLIAPWHVGVRVPKKYFIHLPIRSTSLSFSVTKCRKDDIGFAKSILVHSSFPILDSGTLFNYLIFWKEFYIGTAQRTYFTRGCVSIFSVCRHKGWDKIVHFSWNILLGTRIAHTIYIPALMTWQIYGSVVFQQAIIPLLSARHIVRLRIPYSNRHYASKWIENKYIYIPVRPFLYT